MGFLILVSTAVCAQNDGARIMALGRAATALPDPVWTGPNPAGVSSRPVRSLSLFATQGFGLSELRHAAFSYVEPLRPATVALQGHSFGFEAYREMHLSLTLARGVSVGADRRFYLGFRVTYGHVAIRGYGRTGAVGLSAGWLARLSPALHVGFQAAHLNRPRWTDTDPWPRHVALGLAYQPAGPMLLLVDVSKELTFPPSVRGGIEWTLLPAFVLRMGFTTAPVRYASGVGLRLGRLAADLAADRHPWLGWSPALSLTVHLSSTP